MHPALEPLDPLRLDRAIRDTVPRVRRWLRECRKGEGLQSDPFDTARWASGRSAYRAVTELPVDDPMREPLGRWVYRLVQLRVNRGAIAMLAEERYGKAIPLDGPERLEAPVNHALRAALREPKRREAWLNAFARGAARAAHAARLLEERRKEVAARLGLDSPDLMESPCDGTANLAEQWLALTNDAFAELRPRGLVEWISTASAEGAVEGWPRHISSFSLGAWFRDGDLLRDLDLDPGDFPPSVNPMSTLRALGRLGASWVDAVAPADQPFAIAHDAFGLRRRRIGALFAALPLLPTFARRRMDVPKTKMDDQLRHLHRAVLLESRALAMRVLLRRPAFEGASAFCEAFEGESERALGFPMPGRLAGSIFHLREDDIARLAGLWLVAADLRRLRDAHDEDWFRNPRALEQLRAENALPPAARVTQSALTESMHALFASLATRV